MGSDQRSHGRVFWAPCRQLDEMENPRLMRLKEKSLYIRFEMVHVPGRFHSGPDAISRVPNTAGCAGGEGLDNAEEEPVSALLAGVSTKELRGDIIRGLFDSVEVETGCDEYDAVRRQSLLAELSQIGESLDKDEYELCSVRTPHLTALAMTFMETIKSGLPVFQ